MDRALIKEDAKQKIKGNLWNILWPLLVIGVLEGIISSILGDNKVIVDYANMDFDSLMKVTTESSSPFTPVITIIITMLNVAYLKYVLNFVRTGKCDFNDIIDCLKAKWLNILLLSILMDLILVVGFMALFVPGVILALAYSMAPLLIIDTDLSPIDALRKSREMMKGYKWNYFVFGLSFIGWILLTPFTLFLLLIWLTPYMYVADVLYYEKLKELK